MKAKQIDMLHQLKTIQGELYRDGWQSDLDATTAHVRDVLDELIQLLIAKEELSD